MTDTCPVCTARDWQHVETHVYRPNGKGLSDYQRLRQRILFEVWHPGEGEVRLEAVACGECGFVCYLPRPDDDAISAKYRFLQEHERSIGAVIGGEKGEAKDRRRAKRTMKALGLNEPGRVLDFGGGDGKLLAPFVDAGHDCYLVDYNTEPLPGVKKLADTLEGVDETFDAIICSHVLEHVADPLGTLRDLRARLRPGGRIYAEVPSEVWRGIPIERDPVTHVNFFTVASFGRLFAMAGLPTGATERAGSYGSQGKPVIVAVAQRAEGVEETRRRLAPKPVDWARRAVHAGRLPTLRNVRQLVSSLRRR